MRCKQTRASRHSYEKVVAWPVCASSDDASFINDASLANESLEPPLNNQPRGCMFNGIFSMMKNSGNHVDVSRKISEIHSHLETIILENERYSSVVPELEELRNELDALHATITPSKPWIINIFQPISVTQPRCSEAWIVKAGCFHQGDVDGNKKVVAALLEMIQVDVAEAANETNHIESVGELFRLKVQCDDLVEKIQATTTHIRGKDYVRARATIISNAYVK